MDPGYYAMKVKLPCNLAWPGEGRYICNLTYLTGLGSGLFSV